jgi:hypothetical protein
MAKGLSEEEVNDEGKRECILLHTNYLYIHFLHYSMGGQYNSVNLLIVSFKFHLHAKSYSEYHPSPQTFLLS